MGEMRSDDVIWVALICTSLSNSTKVSLELEKILDRSKICALLSDSTPLLRSGHLDRESA